MKDLTEYIVKEIVSNKDAVVVEESRNGQFVDLYLSVDPEDMGLVIGKAGQNIKAIRRLLGIRAGSEGVRVNIKIKEPSQEAA